ncbi:MAG: NAD(P)/FAD-dependent oxidoreductase [Candidatus Lindowbacteria bacterium]|nr:NAD(P)/FAD-dependent oxidoreductase [Candidatus Lindowbacteria bacterium]
MRIAVVGGGISGLSAAYFLLKRGHKVTLFERDETLGGLAASFDFSGAPIEKYYHFICLGDNDLIDLCEEVGLRQKLFWRSTKMSFLYEGKLYPFGTPLDLLFFKPVSILGRIRFGFNIVYARSLKYWQALENEPAEAWLIRHIGKQAYDVIWRPLLKIKFGEYAGEVAASWMWHRIHRVAKSRKKLLQREELGYLVGGTKMLMDTLAEKIRQMGGEIRTSSQVTSVVVRGEAVTGLRCKEQIIDFDGVVSTVALPLACRLLPKECAQYRATLARVKYIGVVCMILKLSRPLTDSFWVNINDPRISFNGIIEYTNLNPRPDLGGSKIAYIPFYLVTTNQRYSFKDQDLLQEYSKSLRLVSGDFNPGWIQDWRVFRDPYAQAICTTNFSQLVPDQVAPVKGFYLIDSTQLYPSDRTISGMIGLAKKLANTIGEA